MQRIIEDKLNDANKEIRKQRETINELKVELRIEREQRHEREAEDPNIFSEKAAKQAKLPMEQLTVKSQSSAGGILENIPGKITRRGPSANRN